MKGQRAAVNAPPGFVPITLPYRPSHETMIQAVEHDLDRDRIRHVRIEVGKGRYGGIVVCRESAPQHHPQPQA